MAAGRHDEDNVAKALDRPWRRRRRAAVRALSNCTLVGGVRARNIGGAEQCLFADAADAACARGGRPARASAFPAPLPGLR